MKDPSFGVRRGLGRVMDQLPNPRSPLEILRDMTLEHALKVGALEEEHLTLFTQSLNAAGFKISRSSGWIKLTQSP